jgi:uncharacterized protein (TIGR03437 family)
LRTGKKSRSEARAAVALAISIGLGACVDNPPHVDAVMPMTAAHGDQVTLTGERFCQSAGVNADGSCARPVSGEVDFSVDGPAPAMAISWTDTTIVVVVPERAPTGGTEVYVTSGGKSSNAVDITIK